MAGQRGQNPFESFQLPNFDPSEYDPPSAPPAPSPAPAPSSFSLRDYLPDVSSWVPESVKSAWRQNQADVAASQARRERESAQLRESLWNMGKSALTQVADRQGLPQAHREAVVQSAKDAFTPAPFIQDMRDEMNRRYSHADPGVNRALGVNRFFGNLALDQAGALTSPGGVAATAADWGSDLVPGNMPFAAGTLRGLSSIDPATRRLARSQGYPDISDPSTWEFTQIRGADEAAMNTQGPAIRPFAIPGTDPPVYSGSSMGDMTKPHGLFVKEHANDIFRDSAGDPFIANLRRDPSDPTGFVAGDTLAQTLGKTTQIPLVGRAENPMRFATEGGITDFAQAESWRYGDVYNEGIDVMNEWRRAKATLDQAVLHAQQQLGAMVTPEQLRQILTPASQNALDHMINEERFWHAEQLRRRELARDELDRVFRERGVDKIIAPDTGNMRGFYRDPLGLEPPHPLAPPGWAVRHMQTTPVTSHVYLNPAQVRSPFANFARGLRNEAGLMKGVLPFAVGAGAAGTAASQVWSPQMDDEEVGTPPPSLPSSSLRGVRF